MCVCESLFLDLDENVCVCVHVFFFYICRHTSVYVCFTISWFGLKTLACGCYCSVCVCVCALMQACVSIACVCVSIYCICVRLLLFIDLDWRRFVSVFDGSSCTVWFVSWTSCSLLYGTGAMLCLFSHVNSAILFVLFVALSCEFSDTFCFVCCSLMWIQRYFLFCLLLSHVNSAILFVLFVALSCEFSDTFCFVCCSLMWIQRYFLFCLLLSHVDSAILF